MSSRMPPRYVPTLTEVVDPAALAQTTPAAAAEGASAPPSALSADELVQRVMRRIDATLDLQLREAVAAVVVEHSRLLAPVLRSEIEAVVRQAVAQAFEAEFGRPPRG